MCWTSFVPRERRKWIIKEDTARFPASAETDGRKKMLWRQRSRSVAVREENVRNMRMRNVIFPRRTELSWKERSSAITRVLDSWKWKTRNRIFLFRKMTREVPCIRIRYRSLYGMAIKRASVRKALFWRFWRGECLRLLEHTRAAVITALWSVITPNFPKISLLPGKIPWGQKMAIR